MFDVSSLIIGSAWASDAAAMPPVSDASGALMRFFPLFAILAIFYVLMIRPQQQQIKKQSNMLKELKKGDKVYLSSGFVGTVSKLGGETTLFVEIAPGVVVEVLRATVTGLYENLGIEEKKDK